MKKSSATLVTAAGMLLIIFLDLREGVTPWFAEIPMAIGILILVVFFFVYRRREKGEERKNKEEEK